MSPGSEVNISDVVYLGHDGIKFMSARLYRPTGNRILVKPLEPPRKSLGGIMYAEDWQTPTGHAVIMGVGQRVIEPELKIGARIYYNWIDGREVEHGGELCRLIDAGQVLGVIA